MSGPEHFMDIVPRTLAGIVLDGFPEVPSPARCRSGCACLGGLDCDRIDEEPDEADLTAYDGPDEVTGP